MTSIKNFIRIILEFNLEANFQSKPLNQCLEFSIISDILSVKSGINTLPLTDLAIPKTDFSYLRTKIKA